MVAPAADDAALLKRLARGEAFAFRSVVDRYLSHLLGVARHAVGHGNGWASAPAIAHPSTLERRISAMLSHQHNRAPLTRRAAR